MIVSQMIKILSATDVMTKILPTCFEEILHPLSQWCLYMQGYALYNQGWYREALAICDRVSETKEISSICWNLSNLYNLIGCCHAQLQSPQRAQINFRKAIQCMPCNFGSILYNIALVIRKAGNCDVAVNAMEILISSFKLEGQEGTGEETALLLHHACGLEQVSVKDISLWGLKKMENDLQKALYLAAHESIHARKFSKALELHEEIDLEVMYPISIGNQSRKYFDIYREQVVAERYLALCLCKDDVEFSFDLPCVATLRIETAYYSCELEKSLNLLKDDPSFSAVNSFLSRGKQLFHLLCTMLCYVKYLFDHKATEEYLVAEEINNMWIPKLFHVERDEHVLRAEVEMIINSLNHVQAKFLLNKAIMMTSENRNVKDFPSLNFLLNTTRNL